MLFRSLLKGCSPTPVTLDYILSEGLVERPQRFKIARLLASAVTQLTFTPWLRTELGKDDIVFFQSPSAENGLQFDEPFVYQAFDDTNTSKTVSATKDFTFFSLGILLVELCFGVRLEDSPIRKTYPVGDAESKRAFDLQAALKWSHTVCENAGEDYAGAVRWCFNNTGIVSKNWRSDVNTNVVQPLEQCLAYFKMVEMQRT